MLTKGNEISHFESLDIYGRKVSTDLFDGDYLLLSFLRGANCPFCNLRFLELLNWESVMVKERIIILTIFRATNDELLKNMEGVKPPNFCYILADPDMEFHNMYDTQQSYWGSIRTLGRLAKLFETIRKGVFSMADIADPPTLPADILVDQMGNVISSYYGKDYADNLDLEEVVRSIRSYSLS